MGDGCHRSSRTLYLIVNSFKLMTCDPGMDCFAVSNFSNGVSSQALLVHWCVASADCPPGDASHIHALLPSAHEQMGVLATVSAPIVLWPCSAPAAVPWIDH